MLLAETRRQRASHLAARVLVADGLVAVVGRHARYRERPGAHSGLAGVALRAGVAVVAGGAVGLRGVGARAGRGVAGAGGVALVSCGAEDGIRAGARPGLTGVGPGAGVAVVAGGAVGLGRVGAEARRGITHTGIVALVGRGGGDRRVRGAGRGDGVDRSRVGVVAAGTRENQRRQA